jgi:flagellar motor protein MotB
MTPEGFVISLHELGFFDSGEARLLPGAADKIKRISGVLMQYGLDMRVEGHSDDVPIHNATFSSNWDLSTARASAVAMMLPMSPALTRSGSPLRATHSITPMRATILRKAAEQTGASIS